MEVEPGMMKKRNGGKGTIIAAIVLFFAFVATAVVLGFALKETYSLKAKYEPLQKEYKALQSENEESM